MEEVWKNSAVITKRNIDDSGTPFSIKLSESKQVIDAHSCIVLNQIPDVQQGVEINGYTEVLDIDEMASKNYKVDYANGVIYFHPTNVGKRLVVNYYGIGHTLLSASRIYTKYDKQGNVLETLEELIDKSKLYIKAIEIMGGSIEVTTRLENANNLGKILHENILEDIEIGIPLDESLENNISQGRDLLPKLASVNDTATQKKKDLDVSIDTATNTNTILVNNNESASQTNLTLQQTIATGQDSVNKINATGNKSLVIGASSFINNEYTWNHSMNNDNLIVNFIDSDTNEPLMQDYKIIDKNNILIRNSVEHPNIKVVLSASYYQGNALFGTNVEEFAGDSIVANAKKVGLKDGNGVVENPITDSDAVFMPDGTTKLTKTISDINSSLEQMSSIYGEGLPYGKINLPSDFKLSYAGFEFPFEIYKDDINIYRHNATPQNQFDWSDAINVYVGGGSSGDGTTQEGAISLARFALNITNNVYGANKKFIVNIIKDVLEETGTAVFTNVSLYFKGRKESISWLGKYVIPGDNKATTNGAYSTAWTLDVSTSLYKTTKNKGDKAIDLINFIDTVEYSNMPTPYTKVLTLAECQNTKGTFYQSGYDIYCNPHKNHNINNVYISIDAGNTPTITFNVDDNSRPCLIFENIGFSSNQYNFNLTKNTSRIYCFNCRFYRGLQDSASFTGLYQAYLFDCIASYGSKDCFNYHAGTKEALAFEFNCVSWGAGKFKLSGGNTTTHSNNGSTAHDGILVLRIGSRYWDCEGPVLADVNNCYSINIGLDVGSVVNSTTGIKSSYSFDNSTNTKRPELVPKYLIDCKARKGYNEYAVNGTENTFIVGDLLGFNKINGNVGKKRSWEECI